jgi:predicted esterase
VPGFETALAAFPEAPGPGRLPIVIAAHGAGDSPEWQCRIYRELLGAFGVVLCPAGPRLSRQGDGRFFPEHHTLERIVLATLNALVKAFPGAVDPERVVYTAYSQGATMGALMLPPHGGLFRRLALVEGGYSEWTASRARRYAETGGERVLFACGTRTCLKAAERSSAILVRAGVESRVVSDLASGHTYGGGIGERMAEVLPWLLEGL